MWFGSLDRFSVCFQKRVCFERKRALPYHRALHTIAWPFNALRPSYDLNLYDASTPLKLIWEVKRTLFLELYNLSAGSDRLHTTSRSALSNGHPSLAVNAPRFSWKQQHEYLDCYLLLLVFAHQLRKLKSYCSTGFATTSKAAIKRFKSLIALTQLA